MYALERNAWKYKDRDKRIKKTQYIEYDYLAPDTINDIFDALSVLKKLSPNDKGEAVITGWENTQRETIVLKVPQSIKIYAELVQLYGCLQLLNHIAANKFPNFEAFKKTLFAKVSRTKWQNIGGQLIIDSEVNALKRSVKGGKIKSWDEIHGFYQKQGSQYEHDKLQHAYTSLLEILDITSKQFTPELFKKLLNETLVTKEWMTKCIHDARAKDYTNPYRKMIYENNEEMLNVIGRLEDNSFIQDQMAQLDTLKKKVKSLVKKWAL
jgi:virulence-associated protein VapD